jgi:hypothetical protein
MEALGAMLVEKLKQDAPEIQKMKGAGTHWRTDSLLND